ncbi:GRAM domain-containing protein 2A isoform X3 [Vombatus ursinus]|uniref:GRAM domain-containing protein 2A isoform X3 n=1 Tax=Vombatus ursinus TaxID=29139 RepID=UPI000FFCE103|nr:GRAM domain-containing protein 2A isoform X3 [Vombatus ursinus]
MHEKTVALKIPVVQLEKLEESPKERSPLLETLEESVHLPEGLKDEDIKKNSLEVTPNKYNHQYHKLFKDIPPEETVLKVCSCALQRDILIQGRLYISANWLCFHASLFGKDIKVVIPVLSVQMIKKHKMARLLPNGLAITTNTSRKYIFVSLISRDSVYDVLRRVCTHLQPSSKKSLCVREYPDEPDSESLDLPPDYIIILHGIPNLSAGAATVLSELGLCLPWTQVTAVGVMCPRFPRREPLMLRFQHSSPSVCVAEMPKRHF